MKDSLKKYTPHLIWNCMSRTVHFILEIPDHIGPQIRTKKYCGVNLYYNRGNGLIKRLQREPIFEQEMCEAIVSELIHEEKPIFLDIGANIGFVSTFVYSRVPHVQIHAFEPGPHQGRLLDLTLKKNPLQSINLHTEALGDRIGKVTFHIHDAKHAALDGLQDTQRRGKTLPIEVPMITLDSWWIAAHKPKISVIKIDTEGAELLVLRGAKECIQTTSPIIFFEIEPENLKAYPYNKGDIENFFTDVGYTISALTTDTYVARPKISLQK